MMPAELSSSSVYLRLEASVNECANEYEGSRGDPLIRKTLLVFVERAKMRPTLMPMLIIMMIRMMMTRMMM